MSGETMIYLKHSAGSKQGQIESFDLERITIGRHPDNALKFHPETDREVSGYHAEIVCHGKAVLINDLQSRNGTYVNGRRINQRTPLEDGDVIQFSPRGPVVVFSIGEPVAGSGTLAVEQGAIGTPETKGKPARIGRRGLMVLAASLAVVVVLGLALWWSRRAFFIALAIALVAVGGGQLAWWWRRRRDARLSAPPRLPEAQEVAPEAAPDREGLKELREKWAEGVAQLRRSNLRQPGEDAVYALPWILVLGERGTGKTEAIRAGNPLAWLSPPVSRQAISGTRTCDWWFFDTLVVLDTPGRYSFPVDEGVDGREWRELLVLLKRSRGQEPLNGVIVTVATDALASRSMESLQDGAMQLRRRLDEMVWQFGLNVPVYLCVTKSDLIPGFTEFSRSVPQAARVQAMGSANEDVENRIPAPAVLKHAFETICGRLDQRRLEVMEDEDRLDVLRKVYLFPEEFRSLRRPFLAFTEALFRPTRLNETPFCRGVFFTSARPGGTPLSRLSQALGFHELRPEPVPAVGTFFAGDLFSTILSQDRTLVRQTALWHRRHRRSQKAAVAAAAVASFVLCGLLTFSFVRNSSALSRLDLSPCLSAPGALVGRPLAQRLKELDRCREVIEGLLPNSSWDWLTTDFGLRRTRQLEEPLRRHYVHAFRGSVLDPLDARIDQRLTPGPRAPLFASIVLQRSNLLTRCQSRDGCPRFEDTMWPNYRVMLTAEDPNIREGDPLVTYLRRTHAAYLRWQRDPRALEEMRARDMERIARWLNAGGLQAEWVLASAGSQFPAVRYRDFWGWDEPAQIQVDPAFTQRAWDGGIQPLLTGLRAVVPEQRPVAEALARFEVGYRREGLRQWERFLAGFPRGEAVLVGRRAGRDLGLKVLEPASPYRRVIDVASANLVGILGAGTQAADVPAWAETLQRYVVVKAKSAEAQRLVTQKPEEVKAKYREEEQQAFAYLAGYLEALDQLRGDLGSAEKSFRSAQKVFEEGEPTEKSVHPLHKGFWNLRGLRGALGARHGDDRIFWALLARPVEITWRVMLDDAALQLQGQWEAIWVELVGLPPGQRLTKIMGFVNGPAAAFLERARERYVARKLLNESIPFTPAFLQFLSRVGWVSPEVAGRLDAPRQIVARS